VQALAAQLHYMSQDYEGMLRHWALLAINRINGGFRRYFVSSSTSDVITDVKYSGHCTPGKKVF
jgi:hypothetical protein